MQSGVLNHAIRLWLMSDNTDEYGSNASWRRAMGAASSHHNSHSLQSGEHVGQSRCCLNLLQHPSPQSREVDMGLQNGLHKQFVARINLVSGGVVLRWSARWHRLFAGFIIIICLVDSSASLTACTGAEALSLFSGLYFVVFVPLAPLEQCWGYVFGSFVCACVCHKRLWMRYFTYCLVEFHRISNLGTKMTWLYFKVKLPCDYQTRYGQGSCETCWSLPVECYLVILWLHTSLAVLNEVTAEYWTWIKIDKKLK